MGRCVSSCYYCRWNPVRLSSDHGHYSRPWHMTVRQTQLSLATHLTPVGLQATRMVPHTSAPSCWPWPLGAKTATGMRHTCRHSRPLPNPLFHTQIRTSCHEGCSEVSGTLGGCGGNSAASEISHSGSWVLSVSGIRSQPAFGPRPRRPY